MKNNYSKKCSTEIIRQRFDASVELYSNLETGQVSAVDSPLMMELITQAAFHATRPITHLLDIGCGAGNNTLKLLQLVPDTDCDLLDLSGPMLDRAKVRVSEKTSGRIRTFQSDFRTVALEDNYYDVILAATVFHHLRDDLDWESAFHKLYRLLKTGGSVWISDLVSQDNEAVFQMMWKNYGDYLTGIGGKEYCQKVFDYIDYEDSPRSVTFQMDLLRKAGFTQIDILHKNNCFAAFGAIK